MEKYKVEVGSFVTRFVQRTITIKAKNEDEAASKAIKKFIDREMALSNSHDPGSPHADFVEPLN